MLEKVSYHYERARDRRAVSYLSQAAQQAEALFAYADAQQLYTRAIRFHENHLPDEPEARFDLMMRRETMLDRQGLRAEQAENISALVIIAEEIGETALKAKAYQRQASYYAYSGQFEMAQISGEKALALYRQTGDRSGEGYVLGELGFVHWQANDFRSALRYNREALTLHSANHHLRI